MEKKKVYGTKKSLIWGRGKDKEFIQVITGDLRALLFWSAIGVSRCRGGAYEEEIANIIEDYANNLAFELPVSPNFKQEEN